MSTIQTLLGGSQQNSGSWIINSYGATVNSYLYSSSYVFGIDSDAQGYVYTCEDLYVKNSGASYINQVLVRKRDVYGFSVWERLICSASVSIRPYDIAVSPGGNVYVLAKYYEIGYADQLALFKLDSNGTLVWSKFVYYNTLSNLFRPAFFAIGQDESVYVAADSNSPSSGAVIAKYTSGGSLVWAKRISPGIIYSFPGTRKLVVDASGNIYFTVYFSSTGFDVLVKMDSSGSILWARQIEGPVYNPPSLTTVTVNGLDLDSNGNCYIIGSYYTSGNFHCVLKTDTNGAVQWARSVPNVSQSKLSVNANNVYYCFYAGSVVYFSTLNSSGTILNQAQFYASANAYSAGYVYPYTLTAKNNYLHVGGEFGQIFNSNTDYQGWAARLPTNEMGPSSFVGSNGIPYTYVAASYSLSTISCATNAVSASASSITPVEFSPTFEYLLVKDFYAIS